MIKFVSKYLTRKNFIIWNIGLLLGFGGIIIQIQLPTVIRNFVNSAIKLNFHGVDITLLSRMILGLLIFSCVSSFLIGYVGEKVMLDLRNKVFSQLLKTNPDEVDMPISEISNRLTNDTEILGKYLSTTIPNLFRNSLLFFGSLISLTLLNWQLSLFLILFLLIFFIIINIFGQFLARLGTLFKSESSHYVGILLNHLNNWHIIKVTGSEKYIEKRQEVSSKKLFKVSFQAIICQTLAMPVQFIFIILIGLALFFLGARQLQNGAINAGEITAILLYLLNIINAANDLSESFFDFQQDRGQLKGLQQLDDDITNNAVSEDRFVEDKVNGIRVVNASYTVDGKDIFKGITMNFKFNHYYVIKGENGSGKTTFIMTLLRLKRLTQGEIYVSTHSKIAYVPQKPSFFIGTIAENLTLGKDVTKEKIIDALKNVNLWNDLNKMNGLDYKLDEKHTLSGGQLQKLAIARALIHDTNLLILDEITANLDIVSKRMITDLLNKLSHSMTIIEITHNQVSYPYAEELNLMKI